MPNPRLKRFNRIAVWVASAGLVVFGLFPNYVGYFSGRHFADSVGWPLLLILLGGLMMGVGTAAVRIHRRFIKPSG